MNINPATEDFVASKCEMEKSIAYKDKLFSKGTFVSLITKKTFVSSNNTIMHLDPIHKIKIYDQKLRQYIS